MNDGERNNSPSALTAWAEVCVHCRCDLRGSRGEICPECGRLIRQRTIRFRDPSLFHAAAASLADEGIEFKIIDEPAASAGFTIWAGGPSQRITTALIISQEDYRQARSIIEELAAAGPSSLVDRHEPVCPRCGGPLDPRADQACTKCGCLIEWIDVEAVSRQRNTDRTAPNNRTSGRKLTKTRLLTILLFVPMALLAALFFAASMMKWYLGPEGVLSVIVMAIGLFVICTLACGLRRKCIREQQGDAQPASPAVRPIVDRCEPICPQCGAELDVNRPEICPSCHLTFQWVDIEVPDIDTAGMRCLHCGYDLTGNTSGLCPECGETIECDPCELVEAATRSLEPVEEEPETETTLWQDVVPLLTILLGVVLGSVLAGLVVHALRLWDPQLVVFNCWLLAIVSGLVIFEFCLRRRAWKQRKAD